VSAAEHKPAPTLPLQIDRFSGGGSWLMGGGVAGVILLLVSVIAMAVGSPDARREACYSYLTAFTFWGGIALASLILLMCFHAVHARWMTVLRRALEVMAVTCVLFIVLFVPIAALGLDSLYEWVNYAARDLPKETIRLLKWKQPYLNVPFFLIRTAFYLLLATFLSQRLFSWSTRQDESGEVALTQRQRSLGAGGLPFIALAISFAAFDWLMSLYPTWFSTIFGVYYFAGSFVSSLSLLAIVTDAGRSKNLWGAFMSIEHTHSIGKLMLAFVCFWTYVAFSQLLLIWIAGLPEEIPFYVTRFRHEWAWVGIFLIFGNFFIPFGALLSRSLKRDPRKLAAVAIWLLLVHYVDIYWLVMPTLHPEGFTFRWTSAAAFLGVGLTAIAFAIWRLRGKLAVPVKDPYLGESLRYRQP
jgi:hypothetical protein